MLLIMRLVALAMLRAVVASSQPQPTQTGVKFSIEDMLSDGSDGQAVSVPKPLVASPVPQASASSKISTGLNGQQPSPAAAIQSFTTLLGGMTAGADKGGTRSISVRSVDVVSGLIEAFMHKVQLQPGEKSCLKSNVGQIAGNVMATGQNLVTAIKLLMKGDAFDSKKKTGSLVSAGIDSALKITSLVTLSMQLLKNCVHGDALEVLKSTGRHLINAKYLGDRFVVNGIDIAHGLADSIVAFEAKDFRRFGTDIGTALRKIVLSNADSGTKGLPEGVPEKDIIQKVTEGVMRGFFVKGSGIVITDSADPDVHIALNLHRCIAGNSVFFKSIWNGIWNLFAMLSLNAQQHTIGMKSSDGTAMGSQPKWAGELMIALLQFPMALQRCGVGPSTQNMFGQAIRSLRYVHVKAKFPDDRIQPMKATDRMARAVSAWTNWDFATFGRQVGMLLRELVMLAFPRKYSIDNAGILRQQLIGYSEQNSGLLPGLLVSKQSSSFFSVVVGGCALSIMVALAAVRHIWSTSRDYEEHAPFINMEDGGCELEDMQS